MTGGHGPHFSKSKIFNETKVFYQHFYKIMITISLSFLSLGTNKYSGKCILGQPEALSLQNFLGEHEGPKKYFPPLPAQNIFGHPTFKNAARTLFS